MLNQLYSDMQAQVMDFKSWLESEADPDQQARESFIRRLQAHFGAQGPATHTAHDTNVHEYEFQAPGVVDRGRVVPMDVVVRMTGHDPRWGDLVPPGHYCVSTYLSPTKNHPAFTGNPLRQLRPKPEYDPLDLQNQTAVSHFVDSLPTRWAIKNQTLSPDDKQARVRPAKVLEPFQPRPLPVQLSIFQPENPSHGHTWVHVKGWMTDNEALQFQGQVEFTVDKKGFLGRVTDASALDFTGEGHEKAVPNALNLYARHLRLMNKPIS